MSISPVKWEENTLVSTIFNDIYFSQGSGLEESEHVFLSGNKLPDRFADNQIFTVIETGFGTGLNFLLTWQKWAEKQSTNSRLHYISIEKYPLSKDDLVKSLSLWPTLKKYSAQLVENYIPTSNSRMNLSFGNIQLSLVFVDINDAFEHINEKADAWYLDGFSPAKNPDMWNDNLYKNMAKSTNKNGTFATYTSAGHVRRGLQNNGFHVDKIKGFGKKRVMLAGATR